MKLILLGNIGCGKTSIAKTIQEKYPHFEMVAIDEFRQRFGDYTDDGEFEAQEQFFDAVTKTGTDQIIECVGVGIVGSMLWFRLHESDEPMIVVLLLTDLAQCLTRVQGRDWSQVPYPSIEKNITEVITILDQKLAKANLAKQWQKRPNVTFLELENNTPDQLQTNIQILLNLLTEYVITQKMVV